MRLRSRRRLGNSSERSIGQDLRPPSPRAKKGRRCDSTVIAHCYHMSFEPFRIGLSRSAERAANAAVSDCFGLKLSAFRLVLAVMSHERVTGAGVERAAIDEFGVNTGGLYQVIRERWLVKKDGLIVATPRAWSIFGFRRDLSYALGTEEEAA